MINVSGMKVWPREVEEVLYEHPAIKEAAAVATPDPTSGECVKAFVVLRDEYKGRVQPSEIVEFCKERIANYKAPKIVVFQDTLPKSSVGKILRRELSEQNHLGGASSLSTLPSILKGLVISAVHRLVFGLNS